MGILKKSWEKEPKRLDVGVEVLDKIAARGSFVVIRDKTLYRQKEVREIEESTGKLEGMTIEEKINQKVMEVNFKLWMENLSDNLSTVKECKNISQIPKAIKKAAIVVAAGPSFKEKKHMDVLKEVKNQMIISVDRMLIPLLSAGVYPDVVVSIDGGKERIIKWYDSPLVDENDKTIGIMAVTVAQKVIKKFPGEKFFFTPQLDELDSPTSISKMISHMTGTPILPVGGNVGVACVEVAAYLGYKNIILTGMDQGYPINIPIKESAYYSIAKEADPTMTPERFKEIFLVYGHNPDFGVDYYTDRVFKYHRDYLVEHSVYLAKRGVTIVNATEGGAVYGGAITGMPLREAIFKYG